MAEDRMLSDEVLLALIKKNSGGGGGGGTDDYNDLKNQPQIGGNTLVGNKTASDLGLVAAENGKGLSTNDYTNEDKAIVGDVTAALAGKQGALTAGKYIDIDANNKISVEREIPDEAFTYTIQQTGDGIVKITKTVNGAVVFEETYSGDVDVTLDALRYVYSSGVQSYTLLIASDTHEAGFKQVMSWWQRETYTENFSTVDHSGEKLVIKSELDAALALKQDKTDNSLRTTDKTVVGAVNELKSGLTNVQDDVKLNTQDLTTPSRTKNLLLIDLPAIKAFNTQGTWDGNSYTRANVTYTLNFDGNGNLANVTVNGTASADGSLRLVLQKDLPLKVGSQYIVSGSTGGSPNTFAIDFQGFAASQDGESDPFTYNTNHPDYYILLSVKSGVTFTNKVFYPMVRLAAETDPTFAPYIPSVDARLDAVESGVAGLTNLIVLRQQTITIASITANSSVTTPFQPEAVSGYSWAGFTPIVKTDGVMITVGWIGNAFRIIARNFNNSNVTNVDVEINWIFVKSA